MCAPTEHKANPEKENFYEELQLVIDQIPKSDTILVLGVPMENSEKRTYLKKSVGNTPYMNSPIEMGRCY
jgi:hypothetical protein